MNALVGTYVNRAIIAVFTEAEGDFFYVNVLNRVEGDLVVAVDNEQTCCLLGELVERLFDVVEVLKIVEVIRVDIEDNRDKRIELQEGVNVLARLADDNVALT